jgi:hypothetical protein
LPWCAAGAEWTLTLVDPPADFNLYMAADARVLIFRERARDHLDTGYPCRARRGCRLRDEVAELHLRSARARQRAMTALVVTLATTVR